MTLSSFFSLGNNCVVSIDYGTIAFLENIEGPKDDSEVQVPA